MTTHAETVPTGSAWRHQHILDLDDFTRPEIETVLDLADRMREILDRPVYRWE